MEVSTVFVLDATNITTHLAGCGSDNITSRCWSNRSMLLAGMDSNDDDDDDSVSSGTGKGHHDDQRQESKMISDEMRKILEIVFFVILSGGISVMGCVGNVINMVVFWKQGFKDSVNISLFGLAIADFGALITLVWMAVCFTPWFRFSQIPFESTDVQYPTAGWPHMFFARSTSLITAFITFERCLCIALPLKVKTIITPTRTRYIIAAIFLFIGASVVPIYYAIRLGKVLVQDRNETLYAIVYRPGGKDIEDVCFALTEFAQLSSFVLVIAFTAVLIHNLVKKTKWRKRATHIGRAGGGGGGGRGGGGEFANIQCISTGSSSGDRTNGGPPTQADKSASRDRRVMVLVLSIACIFITCFLPSATNLVVIILLPGYNITGRYKNMFQVTGAICNTCESVNSSVNIFVYYTMSSRYRAVFRELFGKKQRVSGTDTNNTASAVSAFSKRTSD